MESPARTYSTYPISSGVARIDEILSAADTSYEEVKTIPERSNLTFTNGFYVSCSAVWVDMRDSSGLTAKHRRPTLAKLYRAYISELVAVMHLSERCREVNIQGDAVWGVFDTPLKPHIDSTFSTAVYCRSVVDLLNCRVGKKNISEIKVGIGVAYGRALMIKAGYSGSGINDVVYMGDVVNEACALSDLGSKDYRPPLIFSEDFHLNLKDENQKLCSGPFGYGSARHYQGSVINVAIDAWINENC